MSGETSHTGRALPCRCKSSDGCKVQEVEACCKTRGWGLSWQNRLAPANPLANPFALLPRCERLPCQSQRSSNIPPMTQEKRLELAQQHMA